MATRITFNASDVHRNIARFKSRFPLAVVRSLNRAAVSARTLLVKEISKDIGIKSGTVRDRIAIQNANERTMVATVSVSGKRIPLIDLNAKGPEPSRGRGRGVTARNPGGAGRYPHAFIATVGTGGHRGVFQRRTRKRLPIRELFGPSLPHVFAKYIPQAAARGEEALVKNIQSELRFALSQGA